MLYLQFDKEGTGRSFEGCMIQLFGRETSCHASTATTVVGPGWPSITFASKLGRNNYNWGNMNNFPSIRMR